VSKSIIEINPGDIVAEILGGEETGRYIVTSRRFVRDHTLREYVMYEAIIIYITDEWTDFHKPGDKWSFELYSDGHSIQDVSFGSYTYKVLFRSSLTWKDIEVME